MPPSFGKAETSRNPMSSGSRGAEGIRTPGLLHAMQDRGVSPTWRNHEKPPIRWGFPAQRLSSFFTVFGSLADFPRTLRGWAHAGG